MSHPALPDADTAFAAALAESPRGPVRDGAFALWLVVRAALGVAPPQAPPAGHGERLAALAVRLKSLNTPGPLKRSMIAAIADLQPLKAVAPTIVLGHLVAPATETLGRRLGEAVAAAAAACRAARATARAT